MNSSKAVASEADASLINLLPSIRWTAYRHRLLRGKSNNERAILIGEVPALDLKMPPANLDSVAGQGNVRRILRIQVDWFRQIRKRRASGRSGRQLNLHAGNVARRFGSVYFCPYI